MVIDRLPRIFLYSGHRHNTTQDKPPTFLFLLLCLPVACRRTTAFGLSEPRGPHLSGLAQTSPSLSPPSAWAIVLFHCFFWPPFLHFCPRDMSAVLVPPVVPQDPDLQSQYTIRVRASKPDEPFEPFPLAALRLAVAAVTAFRLPVQYGSIPVSHGLRGLV